LYTLPGGTAGSASMTQSGTTWSAAIGAATTKGSITYEVRATGSDGRVSTSSTGTVTVRACTS
jgi:hypothetical protein